VAFVRVHDRPPRLAIYLSATHNAWRQPNPFLEASKMQNPPPGPPPGGQPPYQPPGGQQPGYPPPGYQTGGFDKKTGAFLAYLGWFVTGIIFLFVGKDDPDVKFHAAQSTIALGGIFLVSIVVGELGYFMLGGLFFVLSRLVWLFGVVLWIICLIRANQGGGARFEIPVIGSYITPYADQLANAVS
jgi:uncharacterized membrane protein